MTCESAPIPSRMRYTYPIDPLWIGLSHRRAVNWISSCVQRLTKKHPVHLIPPGNHSAVWDLNIVFDVDWTGPSDSRINVHNVSQSVKNPSAKPWAGYDFHFSTSWQSRIESSKHPENSKDHGIDLQKKKQNHPKNPCPHGGFP